MKGLFESSKSYYEENEIYETFSRAEDKPNHILHFLKEKTRNKNVLDVGCGTGKYSAEIVKGAKSLIGVDKSENQLQIAKAKIKDKNCFICVDASNLPFKDNSFDVIISCWCVGTILDKQIQQKVLNEVKRVVKPNGKIYFVENDIGGEFEQIRGRYPNTKKTQEYNDFLIFNGFEECKKIKTYFEFESLDVAKTTFSKIWGNEVSEKINLKKIEHNIVIFKYKKN